MNAICYPSSGLLSLQQAQQHIQSSLSSISETEAIPLSAALGRVLASDQFSAIDIPGQRISAMDGYAYTSQGLTVEQQQQLPIVGCSWAGKPYTGKLDNGQCVRIFTGAVVPETADSVVAQEQVEVVDNVILLRAGTPSGKNIRLAGSDTAKHSLLIAAPKRLTAIDLGVLASAGIAQVTVVRKLRIGHFSTGDELCPLDQPLETGQIYDSNRYLLGGLLTDPNHQVTDLGVIPDDLPSLLNTLNTAAQQFDVLISSGGVSVGEADLVKIALQQCGQVDFWKLAIKPGKPLAFGKIGTCWFFGLPGNPVAVLVTYQQLVRHALNQLSGLPHSRPLQLTAISDCAIRKGSGRQEFQRGLMYTDENGQLHVTLAGGQDSHQLRVASLANCFIILPLDSGDIAVGSPVTVEPFDVLI